MNLLREKHDHSSKQICLERDHIQNRQTLLEDELSQKTRHLIEDKMNYQRKKSELSQEITDLEAKLSELRSEFDQVNANLSEIETNLDKSHASVSEERSQLALEMNEIQKQEAVLHEQQVMISNKVFEIEEMEKESLDSSITYKNKLELLKAAPDLFQSLENLNNSNNNNHSDTTTTTNNSSSNDNNDTISNTGYPAELESALFSHFEEGMNSELYINVNKLEEAIDRIVTEMEDCKESLKNLEWKHKIENEKLKDLDDKRKKFTQVKKYKEAQQAANDRIQVHIITSSYNTVV